MKHLLTLPRQVFARHAAAPQHRHAAAPVRLAAGPARHSVVRTGQGNGCGAGCGCVCEMSLSVDSTGVVESAGFVSKQLLLGPGGRPLHSSRGQLLASQCECAVVNGLSSLLTTQLRGSRLDYARNAMLYAPRAPDAAVRALARRLDLQPHQTSCVQVVETALVAALDDRRAPAAKTVLFPLDGAVPGTTAPPVEEEGELGGVDFREQWDYV